MFNDLHIVYENGKPTAIFRKSQLDTVRYGMGTGIHLGRYGCYVGVKGTTVFIPNIDIETFCKDILGEPLTS